jgi:hypothetical protein
MATAEELNYLRDRAYREKEILIILHQHQNQNQRLLQEG